MDAATWTQETIRRETEATADAEPGKYGFAPDPEPEAEAGGGNGHDTDQGEATSTDPTAGLADHLSDLGLAKRFIGYHGHLLRYCYPWQAWLFFDGCRWTKDDRGEVARRMKATVSRVYGEAAESTNGERRKAVAKFALSSESDAKRKAAIASAQSEPGIPVLPDDLDRDRWLLNVLNGILDLRTGQLIPHDPGHLISKLAPVYFLPEATCTTWRNSLDRVMNGNDRLIYYLQKAVGYTLTGDTSEQVLHFLYGLGANGKSTFIETIMAMLGCYAKMTSPETIMVKKTTGGIPNDLAGLKGARLVSAQEVESGRRLAESLVKSLTGGDTISARFLHGEFFEFKPTFKLWISGNSKPVVWGNDYAIWRRIRLIPFTVQIPAEEQDRRLSEKLRRELPGILNWSLAGCMAWQKEGLTPPEEVAAATENYRDEMDVIGQFIAERCLTGPGKEVTAKILYAAFGEWSKLQGEKHPLSQQIFGMRMAERGFSKRRGAGGKRYWEGLGIVE